MENNYHLEIKCLIRKRGVLKIYFPHEALSIDVSCMFCNSVLQTVLPAAARDIYYRDEIGNISTSHMREQDDSVELELRPRFPLFGGWKTHYYMGYNVPSYQYLFNSGE